MSMEIDEVQSLQFSETISGSQKAPELTRKLKDLHAELKALEQGTTNKDSLRTAADQLVHKQILENSNGTVKILAAICMADIFRLYAPDPPYNNANLKRVFTFFSSQLSLFEKKNNTYEYRFYLLESLSTVKTIIILGDIDQAEDIINNYFFNFFKVAANKDVGNNVKLGMTEILVQIIEEIGIFSQDCVELILEQFGQYEKESTEGPYQMAFEICRSCPNIIQRRVCQYFSDIIAAVGRSSLSDEDIDELKQAHELIRKVYSIMPELLLNVLPQLQDEMLVEEDSVRDVVTETIGQMFAESDSHLIQQYPALWQEWLGRRMDKNLRLRLKWLDMVEEIAVHHPNLVAEINGCLKSKLADPEEKVRASTCKVVGQLQSLATSIKQIDKKLLEQTAERARDKKVLVRRAATDALGAIYNKFFGQLNEATDKLGWIPSTLLNGMYTGDLSITVGLEGALQKHILPEEHDDAKRVERLVTVVGSLDDRAAVAFTALVMKQKSFMDAMHKYVEMCETNNVDEHQQSKNEEYMKYLAAHFPDKARTTNSLLSYSTSICTKKDIKLLKTSINPEADYKTVMKAKTSFLEELNETDGAVAEIFVAILNKASPTILNKSCIPELLKLTQSSRGRRTVSNQRATIAKSILMQISENYPIMYKSIQKDLMQNIVGDGSLVDESLEILAENCKSTTTKIRIEKNVVSRLVDFVKEGTYAQAEHASIILANAIGAVSVQNQLIESLTINLEMGYPKLNIILHALSQFALYCPESLDNEINSLIYFVEKDLLTGPSPECAKADNKLWCSFDKLPLISQEKIIGVRLLINYLTGCEKLPGSSQEQSSLIFPILWSLLDRSSSDAISAGILASEPSHLRRNASLAIIKLTEGEKYGAELTIPKFERLALISQDNCYNVRRDFAECIMRQIQSEQLHCRYMAALFLLAYEPEADLLKQVKKFTGGYLMAPGREKMLSVVLTHLIHLMAHHPDFSVGLDELDVFANYFKYFLASVATPANVSLLFHTAQRIKISSDAVVDSLSQNSYVLVDLLCLNIRAKCKDSNWALNAYGERIQLHPKLYRPLQSNASQNQTLKTSFLPTAYTDKMEESHNQKLGDKRIRALAVSSGKRPKL